MTPGGWAIIAALLVVLWLVPGRWGRHSKTTRALSDLEDHQPENVEEKD